MQQMAYYQYAESQMAAVGKGAWPPSVMGYPPASQASRAHPSTGHMVDPGQAMAAQFYQPGGAMAQGAHPGHTAAAQASSLARLTQMTHSLTDLPGLPGAQAVPGHPVPQPAPSGPASTSSKSTPSSAPRQSKSKSRATPAAPPTTPAPQAAAAPAGHPALLPHGYPYPAPPHHAPAAQARGGQPQIAPRPSINHAVMQQYAQSLQAQQYQQYANGVAMLQNPALMYPQMYSSTEHQRSGGQIYPGYGAMYPNMYR